jgi:hypothetical protein
MYEELKEKKDPLNKEPKTSNNPVPVFNDGTSNDYEYERLTNTHYKSNDRKRWEFVTGWACPFRINYNYIIQRQLGDIGTPNEDGHDENGWRPAPVPAPTRLVLMEMGDDGQVLNVHSEQKKKQQEYKR